MKSNIVLGLMSGTSLDGLDLALVKFDGDLEKPAWEILHAETVSYSEEWIARLEYLPQQNAEILARTNVMFGHELGKIASNFIKKYKIIPDLVSSHGHTIFHQPQNGFTLQIGDGQTMVSYLPCPLVNDFRSKDVAWGGQGAPLVPAGEKALFPETSLFLNLGGIANISLHTHDKVVAWDISACNLIFNWLRNNFDKKNYDIDGHLAESGKIDVKLLGELEKLEYFAVKPPKSLGREWLETCLIPIFIQAECSLSDQARTYAEFLSNQIFQSCLPNSPILITGGGAHNRFFMQLLKQKISSINSKMIDVSSLEIDFKEALIFAWLGLMAYNRKKNVLPSVTGAKKSTISGAIHFPN